MISPYVSAVRAHIASTAADSAPRRSTKSSSAHALAVTGYPGPASGPAPSSPHAARSARPVQGNAGEDPAAPGRREVDRAGESGPWLHRARYPSGPSVRPSPRCPIRPGAAGSHGGLHRPASTPLRGGRFRPSDHLTAGAPSTSTTPERAEPRRAVRGKATHSWSRTPVPSPAGVRRRHSLAPGAIARRCPALSAEPLDRALRAGPGPSGAGRVAWVKASDGPGPDLQRRATSALSTSHTEPSRGKAGSHRGVGRGESGGDRRGGSAGCRRRGQYDQAPRRSTCRAGASSRSTRVGSQR